MIPRHLPTLPPPVSEVRLSQVPTTIRIKTNKSRTPRLGGSDSGSPIPFNSKSPGFFILVKALVLLSLFWVSGLEARERQVVAVLPVKVLYPAQGKQWHGYFLQDELSRQFQLQKHFTALSPGEVSR